MFGFSKRFYFFKRGICLLITALMLILNGTGSSLDTDKAKLFSITGSKNTLLSVYSHCFYEPTAKLTSDMPMGNTKTHTMYMAKNETEFCQIAVRSTKSRKSSYVKVSDFTDKNGNVIPAELFYEYEVIAPDGYYSKEPDALLDADHEWKYWSLQETILFIHRNSLCE